MYIDKFWKYFEQTGDIEAYLYLKQYEQLQNEYIDSNDTNISLNETEIDINELDGMK